MKISWTKPDFDGGTPIIGYLLEYKEKASAGWIKINFQKSTDTTTVIQGLYENTEYEFRVYAENKVGFSDVSRADNVYRTLGTLLNMNKILVQYICHKISFDAILCIHLSFIYKRSITHEGLPYSQPFIFSVILKKSKPHLPGKPIASDIKATKVKVSWTPPDVDGGTPIIGYLLEYK